MAIDECCKVCEEKLDDRDLLKGNILSCWKCGWKKEVVVKFTEDEYDSYLEDYIYLGDFYSD